jgi:hypothetical protein
MENKKRLILITVVVLVLILGFALVVNKFTKPKENIQPTVTKNTAVTAKEDPTTAKPRSDKETLPTVEMGNAIGVVQSITADSLTVKTEEGKTLTLAIKGAFNVFVFTPNGSEQKNASDVKVGSKVSVQYSKDNVVKSMYLMK